MNRRVCSLVAALALLSSGACRERGKGSAAPVVTAAEPAKSLPAGPPTYELKGEWGFQKLWIVSRKDKLLEFALQRGGACERTVSGVAIDKYSDPELGTEIDSSDDDDESAYAVDEYWYEGPDGRVLAIRIDAEGGSRARIKDGDKPCPFDEGVMRRVGR